MRGRIPKEFHEYLIEGGDSHVDHEEYMRSPATAFLRYTVEAKSAVNHCLNTFTKNMNGSFSKASQDSLEHISSAMLPTVMGHFETYQRSLFAGCFDYSPVLTKFDVAEFFKKLSKYSTVEIDLGRLAAHRGIGAKSIGLLLADSMGGWHSPEKVNEYFDCFGLKTQFYSADDVERLRVLWQIRHSIVHTGGTITLPDAQKVKSLHGKGSINIVFENGFTGELARKFHKIIKLSTNRLSTAFLARVILDTNEQTLETLKEFFQVKSSVAVWLN
jgi:hypothetical protein